MTMITKNQRTIPVVVVVAALAAALMATGTVAMLSSSAAAYGGNRENGGNSGISVPTITAQNQSCQTAGGTSPITGACIATSTNTVTESGGVVAGP